MWNKIEVDEDTGSLENYPMREDDVVFLEGSTFYTGFFNNETNHEQPDESEFGFYHFEVGDFYYHEAEGVAWCYKADLIESML